MKKIFGPTLAEGYAVSSSGVIAVTALLRPEVACSVNRRCPFAPARKGTHHPEAMTTVSVVLTLDGWSVLSTDCASLA